MGNLDGYRPRITIEVRQDQYDDLRGLIDWGIRSKLLGVILDDLIVLLKRDRAAVTSLLLSRDIELKDFLKGVEKCQL